MNIINNINKSQVLNLRDQVCYLTDQVVRKVLVSNTAFTMTLFAMDQNQEISTDKSDGEALLYCLEGNARMTIDDNVLVLEEGNSAVLPIGHPHALYTMKQTKFLLIEVYE